MANTLSSGLGLALLVTALSAQNPAVTGATTTGAARTVVLAAGQNPQLQWADPPPMAIDPSRTYSALITTTMGDIRVGLLPGEAPLTVNNFVFLARQGFYENVPFHRIISGFMVQTGDPTGTGSGGPGYRFEDEPVTRAYTRGTVAMANAGPNTNGSQLFIVHGQNVNLPSNYTIFGDVTDGLDVLDRIAAVEVQQSRSGERSVPAVDVRIRQVTITET